MNMARRRKINNNTRKRGRSFGRPSRQALTSMTDANGKMRDPRPIRIKINPVTVPLSWPGPDIAVSTSGASGGAIILKGSDFSTKFNEYAAIFDQFKILQWSVNFLPPNPQIGTGSTNVNLGLLHTAIDFTEQTSPVNAAELESYSTYRFARHPRSLKREVRAVYNMTNGSAGVYNRSPVWYTTDAVSLANFDLYGVKWVHDQVVGITNGQVLYKTVISAVFKFRLSK